MSSARWAPAHSRTAPSRSSWHAGDGRVDELGLPAVAVRRDDHLAGQRVGRGRAPLAADEVQQGVHAGRRPGAGDAPGRCPRRGPSGRPCTAGKRAASSPAHFQCVVTRLPSSSPAAASTNAPVQWLTMIAPAGVGRAERVEQRRRGNAVEQLPRGDRDDVGAGQPVEPVLDGDRDAGVGAQHARRLARPARSRTAGRPMCAAVVAEHLGADPEPETADETVGDDDADDQRTTVLSHARHYGRKTAIAVTSATRTWPDPGGIFCPCC